MLARESCNCKQAGYLCRMHQTNLMRSALAAIVVGALILLLCRPWCSKAVGEIWTCASCASQTEDPAVAGWHLFADGLGEEHALCDDCIRLAPETDQVEPPEN